MTSASGHLHHGPVLVRYRRLVRRRRPDRHHRVSVHRGDHLQLRRDHAGGARGLPGDRRAADRPRHLHHHRRGVQGVRKLLNGHGGRHRPLHRLQLLHPLQGRGPL